MPNYSESFNEAFKRIMKSEGGYVNDPNDPGGETKYGVCKRSYPNEDIKNLTLDRAKEIYHKDFWSPFFYDKVPHSLAEKVFDTAINIGNKKAFKILQKSANKFGANLTEDGVIGNTSLTAILNLDEAKLLAEFRIQQAEYYKELVKNNPKLNKFLKGWLNRAAS